MSRSPDLGLAPTPHGLDYDSKGFNSSHPRKLPLKPGPNRVELASNRVKSLNLPRFTSTLGAVVFSLANCWLLFAFAVYRLFARRVNSETVQCTSTRMESGYANALNNLRALLYAVKEFKLWRRMSINGRADAHFRTKWT